MAATPLGERRQHGGEVEARLREVVGVARRVLAERWALLVIRELFRHRPRAHRRRHHRVRRPDRRAGGQRRPLGRPRRRAARERPRHQRRPPVRLLPASGALRGPGVLAGAYDVVIAAGVESMSRVPMFSNTIGQDPFGPGIAARYPDGLVPQGISAELIAARWELPRSDLDRFALESHRRAAAATEDGRLADEIAPIDGVAVDESIRPETTLEALAALKPAFEGASMSDRFPQIDWKVTAGNSSPINDGSAALLTTTPEIARDLGLEPKVRLHSFAVVGDGPLYMLTGVIPATAQVLQRAGLSLD